MVDFQQLAKEINDSKKLFKQKERDEVVDIWHEKKWPIMAVPGEGSYVRGFGWSFDISRKQLSITIAPQKSQRFDVSSIDQIQKLLTDHGNDPIDFDMYIRLNELRKKLL